MKTIIQVLVVLAFAGWVRGVSAIEAADIVVVDGTEWAQADLFTNLSWNDINAVCPSGACSSGGMLNGHDMTGWGWASIEEMNALFNHYIGSLQLGPGPDQYAGVPPYFVANFSADGWRVTNITTNAIQGLTRELKSYSAIGTALPVPPWYIHADIAATNQTVATADIRYAFMGGWFYRVPNDGDGDGLADAVDNCPSVANTNQINTDGSADGGDACDTDDDNDNWEDDYDNCPTIANPDQADSNGNGLGDLCDIPGCG